MDYDPKANLNKSSNNKTQNNSNAGHQNNLTKIFNSKIPKNKVVATYRNASVTTNKIEDSGIFEHLNTSKNTNTSISININNFN